MYRFKIFNICLLILLLSFISTSINAQTGVYCNFHRINDIAWSPDGEYLAIMTLHGVLIYDQNLELMRSIEAPVVAYDSTSTTGLVWSPDSEWIILPDHTLLDIAPQGYSGWSIANSQTGELRSIISPFEYNGEGIISELVWSPDNDFILVLQYGPAKTTITKIIGLLEGGYSPIVQEYDDIHLSNLQWSADNGISAHQNGIVLSFNSSLELLEIPPTLHPSWWITNASGTYEVAQPNFVFFVRAVDEEAQNVIIDPMIDHLGEVIALPLVNEVIWLSDDEHLIAIYQSYGRGYTEQSPELGKLLQGVFINAPTATQEQGFLLQADGNITGYAVSNRGDRIALYRDEIWVELWNPLSEERLHNIEIPALPIMDTC